MNIAGHDMQIQFILDRMDLGVGPFTVAWHENLNGFCIYYANQLKDGDASFAKAVVPLNPNPFEVEEICRSMNRRASNPTEEEKRNDYANYYF